MSRIIIQRVVIIAGLISVLFGLQALAPQSLLLNLPDDLDIIQAVLSKRAQEEAKYEALEEYYKDYYDNYYEQLLQEEQERLEEEQAIINAYTLGDRDKAQDYQNLFDNSIKHTFIIEFDSTEWQGLIDDMELYNSVYGTYRSNNYRKVDVIYQTDDEEFRIPDVGIRSKGNIFSRYPPVDGNGNPIPIHYVLKFNETFDTLPGTEEYTLLKTREVFDLEKLAFKWNRNGDSTYLSEVYSMQVFRDAGVPAPNMSLTKFILKIDGVVVREDLYSVQEVIDEEFIRKHLEDTPTDEVGDLYKVVWPGTLEPITDLNQIGIRDWVANYRPTYGLETNEELANYSRLINFTFSLDTSNTATRKTFIDNNINVDSMIRAFAASVLLGNPDDYRGNANNYYIYFDLDGYFNYIPYDFDHSLGQGWNGSPVFIDYSLGNDIYIWEGDGFGPNTDDIPLIDNILLEYEEYQILYENYLEQFVTDGTFSYAGFSDLFDMAYTLYGDEFWMANNKEYYINTKITNVLEDIAYYRNLRN